MPQIEASVKAAIAAKLEVALKPASLDVIDESAQHAGHMLHHDQPATVARLIERFFAD